ncbi:hypothetical protein QUF72_23155 [Desulfobacterales bacterium HSG2]|nr:hypothetical protein [Desulfobacterales bacterium HSG2]
MNLCGSDFAHAETDCAAQTDVSQAECESLIALYKSTDGLNWSDSATNNWNDDNNLSDWTGLLTADGQVLRKNKSLKGTLPDVSALTQLNRLSLSDNIAAGGTESFQIQLDAGSVGTYSGALRFENNDSDENPFNFTITGEVSPEPEIERRSGNETTILHKRGRKVFGRQ